MPTLRVSLPGVGYETKLERYNTEYLYSSLPPQQGQYKGFAGSMSDSGVLTFSRSTDRVVRGMLSETVVLVLIEKSR